MALPLPPPPHTLTIHDPNDEPGDNHHNNRVGRRALHLLEPGAVYGQGEGGRDSQVSMVARFLWLLDPCQKRRRQKSRHAE